MEQIQTLMDATAERTPHYPIYCAIFLARAKPLDAVTKSIVKEVIEANNVPPVVANHLLAQSNLHHIAHLLTATKFPLQNLGWVFASRALPLATTKDFCQAKIDALAVAQADNRAQFLTPYIGQTGVAQLLPQELHTEQAAAYMRERRRYALQSAIDEALTLKALSLQ